MVAYVPSNVMGEAYGMQLTSNEGTVFKNNSGRTKTLM
jgi:hypothetical protein